MLACALASCRRVLQACCAGMVLTGVEGVISPGVRELRQSGYRCWQNLQYFSSFFPAFCSCHLRHL